MRCYLFAAFLLLFIANFAYSFQIKPKPILSLPTVPKPIFPGLIDILDPPTMCLTCCGRPPCCNTCGLDIGLDNQHLISEVAEK